MINMIFNEGPRMVEFFNTRNMWEIFMHFKSDNTTNICKPVMDMMIRMNHGHAPSYGQDTETKKTKDLFCDVFEKDVTVFFVSTGTAANSLALSALIPGHGCIFAHKEAHIHTDEANAPELFTGGAKIIPLSGLNNKISSCDLDEKIIQFKGMRPHMAAPTVISISQSTEAGTVYQPDDILLLHQVAQRHGLSMHMDGARFANALVATGVSAAELTWKVGIDVLCLSGTKNGCLAAEAVVFFHKEKAAYFDYMQKRGGQLMSKMRFFATQFQAYFENDLWLKNARHANQMAVHLARVFQQCSDADILYPIEANEVFVKLRHPIANYLRDHGVEFYDWGLPNNPHYRFVTSFATTQHEIENLEKIVRTAPNLPNL